jgi:asparagine synthase (glutamine-hydrolysing)
MCGIWALFGVTDERVLHTAVGECFKVARRGPDATRIETVKDLPHSVLAFHRLEINDSAGGMQPMRLKRYPHITLICNGEIYNAFALRDAHGFEFESRCDVEVIVHLYEKFGAEETARMLDGIFAFALVDTKRRLLHLGRDVFGVLPMFTFSSEGVLGLCSEVKGLQYAAINSKDADISPFPPGHVRTYELGMQGQISLVSERRFVSIGGSDPVREKGMTLSSDVQANVRKLLKEAVRKRLMTERPIGCLLSGGLDSSLVAALVVESIRETSNGFVHKGCP